MHRSLFVSRSFVFAVFAMGFVGASAARAAVEVIVDNTDAGFSVLSGTWSTATSASGKYGTNYRYATTASSVTAEVQWQPSLPSAGSYEVYVWYPAGSNRISDARYTVYYDGGSQTISVNQTANAGVWVLLGSWSFPAGSNPTGRVSLTNLSAQTGRRVYADAVRFYRPDPPDLTMAVSPAGAGTTIPAVGGPYPKTLNEIVSIQATPTAGYVFSQWTVSAGSAVASPTSASTTVAMDQSKTVTAVFLPIELTMAVSPPGAGTTTPAVGGPYPKTLNEIVSIQATPAAGNTFSHWTVSAGSSVADPNAASTTVTMDTAKTVTAVFNTPPPPEFRGFWADAFHIGMQTQAQVDQMISLAVEGGYNAIVPEVLAFHDNEVGSHGAYWRSNIVARTTYVTEDFDPLEYMCQQAHANGLQIHCWLVAFRVSSTWPPPGNEFLAAHPEWLKVPRASMGTVAKVGSYYEFDPGSPEVQEYLMSVVRELVTNYPIDGIHWDYIRYTAQDSGYPADNNYANSSLKRFQRIYNRSDVPAATGDTQWDDFRRRSITEVVRRAQCEIPLITSNPRQPVRHSAAVVTWYPCNTNFHLTRPYYEVFSDWEDWASNGYLDSPVLMAYFDEDGTYKQTYRDWVNNSINLWRYGRQTVIGPGIYMNSFANSVIQMQYARSAGADGLCTYSYNVTNDTGTTWTNWYPYVATNFFNTPAACPPMSWRVPATSTEGTIYGIVTDAGTGLPIDDAAVQVGALPSVRTDANGYYVVNKLPAAAAGTAYSVTATKGSLTATHTGVLVFPAGLTREDMPIGSGGAPPTITQQPQPTSVCQGTVASFTVAATGDGVLTYRWQKNSVNLSDGGHYSGVTTAALVVSSTDASDVGNYRCVVTNGGGSTPSDQAALTLRTATVVTQQPSPQTVCPGSNAQFSVAAAGDGTITYRWQKDGSYLSDNGHYSGCLTPTLTITGVVSGDAGNYRCVVSATCGGAISNYAALSLRPATTITQQPAAQSVCAGATAVFTVAATGEGTLTYRWQKGGTDLSDGGHYAGTATATLTVSGVDAGDVASYRCVVTGGCGSATSNAAALTLKGVTITQQPSPQTTCAGSIAVFAVDATGSGTLSYRWQKDGVDLVDDGHFWDTATPTLTVSEVTPGDAGGYRCVVADECGGVPSEAAPLTVKPTAPADLDVDCDVDLADFGLMQTCFNGANRPPAEGCTANADLDGDDDVDLADFAAFQTCYNGPNRPPAC